MQSDNGKKFTDRFGKGGEVMFDRICHKNGIMHRLTDPFSPNQNGKVERFHGTLRPDFLDQAQPFTSLNQAQSAVDAWVADYNTDRPHHALDLKPPVTPSERFALSLRSNANWWSCGCHPALEAAPTPTASMASTELATAEWSGGPVELGQVVPAWGNMSMAGR